MSTFVVIRPQDDAVARQASDWCDKLVNVLTQQGGHIKMGDVNSACPASQATIVSAMQKNSQLVFYFGHGTTDAWTVTNTNVIDPSSISCASRNAVVSIACKTGQQMGSDAITAGAIFWLGFTIKVPVIRPYKNIDPIGEAIYGALAGFGSSKSAQEVHRDLIQKLDRVATEYDTGGKFSKHPEATMGYFFAMVLRDHIVVHGNPSYVPM
jgi:Peptidase family C25